MLTIAYLVALCLLLGGGALIWARWDVKEEEPRLYKVIDTAEVTKNIATFRAEMQKIHGKRFRLFVGVAVLEMPVAYYLFVDLRPGLHPVVGQGWQILVLSCVLALLVALGGGFAISAVLRGATFFLNRYTYALDRFKEKQ